MMLTGIFGYPLVGAGVDVEASALAEAAMTEQAARAICLADRGKRGNLFFITTNLNAGILRKQAVTHFYSLARRRHTSSKPPTTLAMLS